MSIVLYYVQEKSILLFIRCFCRIIDLARQIFRRYTGEGMDVMEFSEAQNYTRDLMWVLGLPLFRCLLDLVDFFL